MKSVINHYYNLFPSNIKCDKDNYYFNINDKSFCLVKYEDNINYIDDLVLLNNDLYNIDNNFMNIIFTKDKQKYIKYNDEIYVLLKINNDSEFNIFCLIDYLSLNKFYKEDKKEINWGFLWSKKVDEIENTVLEYNDEYPIILESINYFIGLAENAISYFNNNINEDKTVLSLSHKRFDKDIMFNFYNPLNIILDYKSRDICNYINYCFYNDNLDLEEIFNKIKILSLTPSEYKMIYARLLYPSYYFDMVEKVVNEEESEKMLIKIIDKIIDYEKLLKDVVVYINEIVFIEKVEWVNKK